MGTLGLGQHSIRQPEIRRAGQCGSGTPERLNRMLCPTKSSREASQSGTKTRRMRVEMLCEFRVEGWLLFPAVHWLSPNCRTGGPVLHARMGDAVRHWPISALAAPQPLTERAHGPFPCACLAAGEAGGQMGCDDLPSVPKTRYTCATRARNVRLGVHNSLSVNQMTK